MVSGGVGKQHKFGANGCIWYGKEVFTILMRLMHTRWFMIHKSWHQYDNVFGQHIFGVNEHGTKFTYCPRTLLISYSGSDYDERYCHGCQAYPWR